MTLEWLEKNTLAEGDVECLNREALLRMFPKWPEDIAFDRRPRLSIHARVENNRDDRVCHINEWSGQRGEVRGLGMTLKPIRCISYSDDVVGMVITK